MEFHFHIRQTIIFQRYIYFPRCVLEKNQFIPRDAEMPKIKQMYVLCACSCFNEYNPDWTLFYFGQVRLGQICFLLNNNRKVTSHAANNQDIVKVLMTLVQSKHLELYFLRRGAYMGFSKTKISIHLCTV